MKQTAIEDRAQAQMQPGVITRDGMLGSDTRRLVDILVEDEAAVRRLGTTHLAIARRMRQLRRAGAGGLGNSIPVGDNFDVIVDGVRGRMPCPYEDGTVSKTNTRVTNRRLEREILFTDLHIHMIERHGFYMGRGSLYRLEPADVVAILEIEPEPAPPLT